MRESFFKVKIIYRMIRRHFLIIVNVHQGTREAARLEYANFDYDEQGNIVLLNPAGFPIATVPPGSVIDASNPFPTDLTNVEITPVFISNTGKVIFFHMIH